MQKEVVMKLVKLSIVSVIIVAALYATDKKVYYEWEVELKPVLIQKVIPEYPVIAKQKGIEGVVRVEIVINEKGEVESAKIRQSDNPVFNKPCLDAAYKLKFRPAEHKGKKVKVKVIIPYTFKLAK